MLNDGSSSTLLNNLVFRLFLLLLVTSLPLLADPVATLRFESTDGKLSLETSEELLRSPNPHAILSLQTPDEIVVVVTVQDKRHSVTELYDGLPASFPEGAECVGRVLLALDGEDAPTFLVEGLFPPQAESTHHTVYSAVNHNESEYTIQIHYPIKMGETGFEWAVARLADFRWVEVDER